MINMFLNVFMFCIFVLVEVILFLLGVVKFKVVVENIRNL